MRRVLSRLRAVAIPAAAVFLVATLAAPAGASSAPSFGSTTTQSCAVNQSCAFNISATGTPTPLIWDGYGASVASTVPLAWWQFNQSGGTSFPDSSDNGNTASAGTALTPGVTGLPNGQTATYFPGNTSASLPDPFQNGDKVSIGVWVNFNGTPPNTNGVDLVNTNHTDTTNYGVRLDFNQNFWAFVIGNGTTWAAVLTQSAVPATGWHYYQATWDGSSVSLYQDGVLQPTLEYPGTYSTSTTYPGAAPFSGSYAVAPGGQTMNIGYFPATGAYFQGDVADLTLNTTALSASQVTAQYNAMSAAPPAAPAGMAISGNGTTNFSISGTPTATGTNNYSLVADNGVAASSQSFALTVNAATTGKTTGASTGSGTLLTGSAAGSGNATAALSAGTLGFCSAPSNIAFPSVTLNGQGQTTQASVPLDVCDATGSGAGWQVDATSTQFLGAATKATLPSNAATVTTSPSYTQDAKATGAVLATDTIAYPYILPAAATAPAATPAFSAAAGTGMGAQTIGSTFTLSIPAYVLADTYSAIWTFTVVTGP